LFIRHTITAQKIIAEVEIEILQDTQISVGYSIMNNTTLTPKSAAVGVGRQISPVTLTGVNQTPNQGRVTSCAMGQTDDSTVLIADWSGNLSRVLASQAFVGPQFRLHRFVCRPFWSGVMRIDSEGRDYTDSPGLSDKSDTQIDYVETGGNLYRRTRTIKPKPIGEKWFPSEFVETYEAVSRIDGKDPFEEEYAD
jgi:hypothetical protein